MSLLTPPFYYETSLYLAIEKYLIDATGIPSWDDAIDATPKVNSPTADVRAFLALTSVGGAVPQASYGSLTRQSQIGIRVSLGSSSSSSLKPVGMNIARRLHELMTLLGFPQQRLKEGLSFGGTFGETTISNSIGLNIIPSNPTDSLEIVYDRVDSAGTPTGAIMTMTGQYRIITKI